jgi:hypothetical protein
MAAQHYSNLSQTRSREPFIKCKKIKTVSVHAMQAYGAAEVQLHSFLTLALACREVVRFTPH